MIRRTCRPLSTLLQQKPLRCDQHPSQAYSSSPDQLHSVIQTSSPLELTQDNVEEFLDRFDTLILDCDGVIWHVDHHTELPEAGMALEWLRRAGKTILFASNNSIPSTAALTAKVRAMTGYDPDPDHNFSVNRVIREYLQATLHIGQTVYLMGSRGLEDDLSTHGVPHFGNGPDDTPPSYDLPDLMRMQLRDNVGAVLVGQDQHFNFMKLAKAASYLRRDPANCQFLATSWETGYQFAPDRVQPIAGSLAQCVGACAGIQPMYLGKPGPHMFQIISSRCPGFDPTRACMVGDSLRSDMGFARVNGIASLLVLSGVSNLETLKDYEMRTDESHHGIPLPNLLPDYYVGSIVELAKMM